jgi:oxaloacetate decarboxylase gamma subunit
MESTIGELLVSGVKLMLIGMGIVYLFLALLVWVINMTATLIQRYSPEVPTHLQAPTDSQASTSESVRREIVAAISAAIHQYQKKSH